MAKTLAELLIQAGDRLNDPQHISPTAPTLRRWINEASRELVRKTECLYGSSTISVVAGTQSYTLPTDVVRINAVQYELNSQIFALEFIEQQAAQYMWGVNQASQSAWPEQYTTWGHPGAMSLKVFPVPSAAGTLRIYYARLPAELEVDGTEDTSPLDVPNGWEDPLLDYVQASAYMRDRRPDEYSAMMQRFQDRVVALAQTSDRNYNVNPGMIVPLGMLDQVDWY